MLKNLLSMNLFKFNKYVDFLALEKVNLSSSHFYLQSRRTLNQQVCLINLQEKLRFPEKFHNTNKIERRYSTLENANQTSDTSSLEKTAADDMPIDMKNPYERERQVCILCQYGIELDYKNPKLLSQFTSPFTGQIYDKHITRLCEKQQKKLAAAIKLSIRCGHMGAMVKNIEFLKDPMLFDPNNPIRSHKH